MTAKDQNGWLDKCKKDTISRLKVNGESWDVQGETVDSWKERLPEWMNYRHFFKKSMFYPR